MRQAARRQRDNMDRLSQPTSRRRTVYVHAYNAEDELRYKSINISHDMTHMSQLMDKIHMAVGYKLITPVVGVYRFSDRTRVHNIGDIDNNEHLIYVCQGEVQNNNNNSYASSQSSEGSQQRQQWMHVQTLARQNSGRSSPGGPIRGRSQRGFNKESMDRQRTGSGTIQYDGTFRSSSQGRQYSKLDANPLQYQFSSSSSSSLRSNSSHMRGRSKEMPRTSLRNSNLRISKTMPQYRQYQDSQKFDEAQKEEQEGVNNFYGGPHSRRAVSFQERSRSPLFLPTQNVAPGVKNVEPRRRRGKSQTDLQFNQDNFSFDVRLDNGDGSANTTTTYTTHLYNKQNYNFIQGQEQQFNNNNNGGRLSPISAPFSEGINFEHMRPVSRQEQHRETTKRVEEKILSNITDASIVRLSPIHEPSESPRAMPPISENSHDKPEADKLTDEDEKATREDEITLSLTLQDIQDAANQEMNRRMNHQTDKPRVQVPELKLGESLDEILRMVKQGSGNDENYTDSFHRQEQIDSFRRQEQIDSFRRQEQIDVLESFELNNLSKSSDLSEENFESRQLHAARRDEDPLEKTMTEEEDNFNDIILDPSQYPEAVDYNDRKNSFSEDYCNDSIQNFSGRGNQHEEFSIHRPTTPFYQDDDVQRAIDNVQHVFGKDLRDVQQQQSDPNPRPPHEYSGSQTSVNSNRDVQVQSRSEQTSSQRNAIKKTRKRSTSFWSCMYLPDVNEE